MAKIAALEYQTCYPTRKTEQFPSWCICGNKIWTY